MHDFVLNTLSFWSFKSRDQGIIISTNFQNFVEIFAFKNSFWNHRSYYILFFICRYFTVITSELKKDDGKYFIYQQYYSSNKICYLINEPVERVQSFSNRHGGFEILLKFIRKKFFEQKQNLSICLIICFDFNLSITKVFFFYPIFTVFLIHLRMIIFIKIHNRINGYASNASIIHTFFWHIITQKSCFYYTIKLLLLLLQLLSIYIHKKVCYEI